jgi:hypothetical protein
MNAQVLLLAIVTGLFVAAWDSDQAAMQTALARRSDAQQHNAVASASVKRTAVIPPVRTEQLSRPSTARTAGSAVVPLDDIQNKSPREESVLVPLPVDLPAGDYQAVNQRGISLRITLNSSGGADSSHKSTRELYISDTPTGERWYLVRIPVPEIQ